MKIALKDQSIGSELNLKVIRGLKPKPWIMRVGDRLGVLLSEIAKPADELESWQKLEYRRENPPSTPIERAQWRL